MADKYKLQQIYAVIVAAFDAGFRPLNWQRQATATAARDSTFQAAVAGYTAGLTDDNDRSRSFGITTIQLRVRRQAAVMECHFMGFREAKWLDWGE